MFLYTAIGKPWYSSLSIFENTITFYFEGISDDDIDYFSDGLFILKALCKHLHQNPIIIDKDEDHLHTHEAGMSLTSRHTHFRFNTTVTVDILDNVIYCLGSGIKKDDALNLRSHFVHYMTSAAETNSLLSKESSDDALRECINTLKTTSISPMRGG